MKKLEEPLLLLPLEHYKRIMAYAKLADGEITGFADVSYNELLKAFVLGDVYLLEQVATGGDVEMDEPTVSKFMQERIDAGATQMPQIWWHSHNDMGVFFSSTDDTTMDEFTNESYTIALVVNKKEEMKAQLNIWKPFSIQMDMAVDIMTGFDEIPQALIDEVNEKVKPKVYTYTPPDEKKNGTGNQGGGQTSDFEGPNYENPDQAFTYDNGLATYEKFTAFLPEDKKQAFKFLRENKSELRAFFSESLQCYAFFHRGEGMTYVDAMGFCAGFAEKMMEDQSYDYYHR